MGADVEEGRQLGAYVNIVIIDCTSTVLHTCSKIFLLFLESFSLLNDLSHAPGRHLLFFHHFCFTMYVLNYLPFPLC